MSTAVRHPHDTPRTRTRAWFGGIAFVVAADQLTKTASGRLGDIPGVLPARNHALSLGVVDSGRWVEVTAMLLGVVLAACWLVPRSRGTRATAATTLLLGGATGNVIDRLAFGYVRDFLTVGPVVINLADLAVVAGLALLLTHRPPGRCLVQAPKGGEHP